MTLLTSPRLLRWALIGALLALTLGCTGGIRDTTTERAAEETLLVTTAAERAVDAYPVAHLFGKRVWIDEAWFESIDKNFVISSLRERVTQGGALLVSKEDEAELVLEPRNGTLGVNDPSWLVGIPALVLPAADATIGTPELSIGYDPQRGWAKFQFWTYAAATGETVDLCETWGQSTTGWFQSITPSVLGDVQVAADGG